MLNKLIIFLIRWKLHLKKGQSFQFSNQKTGAIYWFTDVHLMKMDETGHYKESGVSLNWLLSPKCKIRHPLIGTGFDELCKNLLGGG